MDEKLVNAVAQAVIAQHNGDAAHIPAFILIMEFLDHFRDRAPKITPRAGTSIYYQVLANRYFHARSRLERPNMPATIPDEMAGFILHVYFGYNNNDIRKILEVDHKKAMAAENIIGSLLERYIGTTLEPLGWAWCAGNVVRAVDLIYKEPDGSWLQLQIKNRDNTENSSSSAVRKDTDIQKWFRCFSRSGETNWNRFPAIQARELLSEDNFRNFVRHHLETVKNERGS